MTRKTKNTSLVLFISQIIFLSLISAQEEVIIEDESDEIVEDSTEVATIESTTDSSRKYEGLFTIYQDSISGKSHMLIRHDQLGKEFF